jgi:ABC-2 type transport system ATP-binding protein
VPPTGATNRGESAALRCRGLVKRFPDVVAVDGLDLEVRRGECFGLLGPNGAGKTTTVEILEGLLEADAGEVEVLGERWGTGRDHALRSRLGIQLQETQLADKLRVEEVIRLFRSFYPGGRDVAEVIATLELEPKRRSQYGKLSGGQKQRVALACALVGDPDVLFLDEPTTGLDPQARRRIWQVVRDFRDRGGTVLLTTHYMEEAAQLCDRVAIVDAGRVLCVDTPRALVDSLGADQIVEMALEPAPDPATYQGLPGVLSAELARGKVVLRIGDIGSALAAILDTVAIEGGVLRSLTTHEPTLEDVFLALTGHALREGE